MKKITKNLIAILLAMMIFTPSVSLAYTDAVEFSNPLQFDTVDEVLGSLLTALQGVIVAIAIIFIIIGAILYMTSAGDEQKMQMAKKAVIASLIGMAIGVAAPAFLRQIAEILGWGFTPPAGVGSPLTIAEILLNVLNFLLSVVGVIGVIMLVVGGVMYLSAAGDERRIEGAKNTVKWAIIGIVISLASLVIVTTIAGFFSDGADGGAVQQSDGGSGDLPVESGSTEYGAGSGSGSGGEVDDYDMGGSEGESAGTGRGQYDGSGSGGAGTVDEYDMGGQEGESAGTGRGQYPN